MSSESNKTVLTICQEFDDITPRGRPTACNIVISLINEYDWWFSKLFCQFSRNQSDNPMGNRVTRIYKDSLLGINMEEGIIYKFLCILTSGLIESFECFDNSVNIFLACKKEREGNIGMIHSSSSINSRSNLKSDNICIFFNLSFFKKKFSESYWSGMCKLAESESGNRPIFSA